MWLLLRDGILKLKNSAFSALNYTRPLFITTNEQHYSAVVTGQLCNCANIWNPFNDVSAENIAPSPPWTGAAVGLSWLTFTKPTLCDLASGDARWLQAVMNQARVSSCMKNDSSCRLPEDRTTTLTIHQIQQFSKRAKINVSILWISINHHVTSTRCITGWSDSSRGSTPVTEDILMYWSDELSLFMK